MEETVAGTLVTNDALWQYDNVFLNFLSGNDRSAEVSFKEVETVDIALTLAKNLNIKEPSGATGASLIEGLGDLANILSIA